MYGYFCYEVLNDIYHEHEQCCGEDDAASTEGLAQDAHSLGCLHLA